MSHKKKKRYHYRLFEAMKMIFVSFLLFLSFLYVLVFYQEIFDYFELDMTIFSAEDMANQSENYNHVFNLLEADIRISEEVINTTEEEYSDEHYPNSSDDVHTNQIIHNNHPNIINVPKSKEYLADKKDNHYYASIDTHKNVTDDTTKENYDTISNDNVYILPLADAFENYEINKQREAIKESIIQEYNARKELSAKIKRFDYDLSKDINVLKAMFASLRTPIPAKFVTLKANLNSIKVLDTFKITRTELQKSYPKLIAKIHEFYRLKVFASFLPINNPVLTARRSSRFGYRSDPFTGRAKMHAGLDFAAPTGVAVFATGVGIIKFAGVKTGYGNVIDIYHGNGIITRYAHLSRIFVKNGQRVSIGQKIGAVGSTGRSTGPHLHYEVRLYNNPVNPEVFLNKKQNILKILIKYK